MLTQTDTTQREAKKIFYHKLVLLVLPIALQNLLNAAVNSADVLMLGYVSQTALSAVSLANQIQFILNLVFGGLASGATMLAAQYWGREDTASISRILGFSLRIALIVSTLVALAAFCFPQQLMYIFTKDTALITAGGRYLRIIALSYLFMGVSWMYECIIRSVERVRTSMMISSAALILNIILNAVFIFGLLGAPKSGLLGVAIATTISRFVEMLLCFLDLGRQKHISFKLCYLWEKHAVLFHDFIHYSLPALGNEFIWGLAFSMYSVIMGHLGSDVVAANSVITVIRDLFAVVGFGIASGGAILLGKEIGDNRKEQAKADAHNLCIAAFFTSLAAGGLMLLCKPLLLPMIQLTPQALSYLDLMFYINAYYIVGQVMNTTVICGVFRSGGDAKYGFICDIIDMWIFAVPLGFLSAFVWKLPVMTVYFLICLDEFVKMPFVYHHYKSCRWLKNITRDF